MKLRSLPPGLDWSRGQRRVHAPRRPERSAGGAAQGTGALVQGKRPRGGLLACARTCVARPDVCGEGEGCQEAVRCPGVNGQDVDDVSDAPETAAGSCACSERPGDVWEWLLEPRQDQSSTRILSFGANWVPIRLVSLAAYVQTDEL